MKKIFLCWLLLWNGVIYGQRDVEVVSLNGNWYFSKAGTEEGLTAEGPGTVHQDLLRHGMLPNPFYGKNEERIQWVEEEDWEYKTTFVVTAEQLKRDAAILFFEGLDTYADVYLNGALLFRSDNMFTGYKHSVKQLLREGKNYLHIYFRSPIRQTLPQWRSNGFDYPADNDHRAERLSVFTRKAPYSYGWDWGIRMVTSGVWRPVSLYFQDVVSVEDYYVRQLTVSKELAKLAVELELKNLTPEFRKVLVTVSWALPGGEKKLIEEEVQLNAGLTHLVVPVEIPAPELWMPNGWGKPVLYDFEVAVFDQKQVVARKNQRIGLRTVRVVKEKDIEGESFYFEVNGIPMFAKGANYIPSDAMLPAVTTERYRTLFKDIKEANMNMLRVWGGGVYEDDRFYDLADENGILIWQDFMFACTTYPHDPVFLSRVEAEAEYNIRRLRNHACLAMWCGNNEILEGLKYWGWSKKYTPEVYKSMNEGYKLLFQKLLPSLVEKWDNDRFYMHGSPYFANWGRPESWKVADSHNWGVWYGRKPFSSLDEEIPRFMSEFGFQSFPEMKTIATFAAPEDYQVKSEVMNAHQKSSIGNDLILTYMKRDYVVPQKFEDFVYVGLVMQGWGMRRGFEAHRRNRPYCMGSLYWQLNDSWPVVSWSGLDYYGNWKALHYQAKRAFSPLLVDVVQEEETFQVWLMSDKLEDMDALTLEMQLTDFHGRQLKKEKHQVKVPANSSVLVLEQKLADWVVPSQCGQCYLLLTLKDKTGEKLFEEPHFFNAPRDLDLPDVSVIPKIKTMDGVCEVTLKSSGLAKDVFIEIPFHGARFSDNFFDLLPGVARKIVISSPFIKKGQDLDVKIKHLRSIYE